MNLIVTLQALIKKNLTILIILRKNQSVRIFHSAIDKFFPRNYQMYCCIKLNDKSDKILSQ